MIRHLGPETGNNFERRKRDRILEKYLSGNSILDIGYRGGDPQSQPITEAAIGIDLDYPGYDGKTLPFSDFSQDAVFASHVLEHIVDWKSALVDWYRVLKINGYLVIAVPHRDLYERKANLPSRFNGDHRRFYTPASLLNEIETALPVSGYRIRVLHDVDEGFDYTVPPDRHAKGSYEIELVLEKIRIPEYAVDLRPPPLLGELVSLYARLVCRQIRNQEAGILSEKDGILSILGSLPLPPFPLLLNELRSIMGQFVDGSQTMTNVQALLIPLIANAPFDSQKYLSKYNDLKGQDHISPHQHYVAYGYFEGRSSQIVSEVFG